MSRYNTNEITNYPLAKFTVNHEELFCPNPNNSIKKP